MSIFRETFRNKTLILFLVAVAFLSEVHQTITVFLNQLKFESCGMDNSTIGIIYSIATILGLLGVCSSAVTKRMGVRRSLALFCALPVVSCLLLGVTKSALPSVFGILTLRISDTLFQPFQEEIQNKQIKTQNRATALSIHSMLISCVAIGTNLVFGALSDWSLSAAFFFGGSIGILSLVFFAFWLAKGERLQKISNVVQEK